MRGPEGAGKGKKLSGLNVTAFGLRRNTKWVAPGEDNITRAKRGKEEDGAGGGEWDTKPTIRKRVEKGKGPSCWGGKTRVTDGLLLKLLCSESPYRKNLCKT